MSDEIPLVGDDESSECLLALCPGCGRVMRQCRLVAHCETECREREMECVNKALGCRCEGRISRHLMREHLASACVYGRGERGACGCRARRGAEAAALGTGAAGDNAPIVAETAGTEREARGAPARQQGACDSHCGACVFPAACSLSPRALCPIESCPNGACAARMHRCKLEEHRALVCPHTVVGCLNRSIGCARLMPRWQSGDHLRACRASVVQCGRQWTRGVQGSKLYQLCLDCHRDSRRRLRQLQRSLIARADRICDSNFLEGLSLRDQLELCQSLGDAPRAALDGATETTETGCDNSGNNRYCESGNGARVPGGSESVSLLGRPTRGINKQRRMASDQIGLTIVLCLCLAVNALTITKKVLADQSLCWPGFPVNSECISSQLHEYGESLDTENSCSEEEIEFPFDDSAWRFEHLVSDKDKPSGSYTFECGQAVARADWEGHWRQHCDLSGQMDGWVEAACPLARLGCTWTATRLGAPRAALAYHPLLDAYCQRAAPGPCSHGDSDVSPLLRLPLELLVRVCALLDGASLVRVSRAHARLRQAVHMMRHERCSRLEWRRAAPGRWSSRVAWFCPVSRGAMQVVDRLALTDQSVGAVSRHLARCALATPRSLDRDTAPFCLHRLAPDQSDSLLPQFLRSTCR